MDASDQTVLATLSDGIAVELDNPDGGDYAIRVNVEDGNSIGSVYLALTGAKSESRTEGVAPYSLYGDGGANDLTGGTLPVGSYNLEATAYSQKNKGGDELGTLSVSFTVTEAAATPVVEADPAAPGNLTYEIVDDGVALTWNAPAEDAAAVTGYQVEWSAEVPGQSYPQLNVRIITDTATTYKDTSATTPGARYSYVVKARRGAALSQASNRVEVRIPDPVGDLAPSNLTYEIVDDGIVLTWTAPVADAGSVTGYQVLRRKPDSQPRLTVWEEDTASTGTTYKDGASRFAGEVYLYRVAALRGDQKSARSNKVTVERPVETAERAPSNLALALLYATDFSVSAVALGWDAPAQDAGSVTGYRVQRAVGDGEFATLVDDTASPTTGYTDSTVAAGETYRYRVIALRGRLQSLASPAQAVALTVPEAVGGSPEAILTPDGLIALGATVRDDDKEFNTLSAAGNNRPTGLWSNGTTMWVAHRPYVFMGDTSTAKIYAYKMADMSRDSGKDFNTLSAAGNDQPIGIWSDGTTMWVVDSADDKIYAYRMSDKSRNADEDFGSIIGFASDIWSNGEILWLSNTSGLRKVFAHDLDTKERLPGEDFPDLFRVGLRALRGIWSDGDTMWVADSDKDIVYAFRMSSKILVPEGNIQLVSANGEPRGLWSDGDTMWVSDWDDGKIYAYDLPEVPEEEEASDLVSVERIAATSAVITTNLQDMPYPFPDPTANKPTERLSVDYGLTGLAWHITKGTASVSMPVRGLEPNTEYTMEVKFRDRLLVGSVTFTTGNSGLASLAVSDVSPGGAQVTVSLLPGSSAQNVRLRYKETSLSGAPGNWTVLGPQQVSTTDEFGLPTPGTTTFTLSGLEEGTTYDVDAYTDTRFPDLFPSLRPSRLPADSWVESQDAFTTPVTPQPVWEATIVVGIDTANDLSGYSRPENHVSFGTLTPSEFSVLGTQYTVDILGVRRRLERLQPKHLKGNLPVRFRGDGRPGEV